VQKRHNLGDERKPLIEIDSIERLARSCRLREEGTVNPRIERGARGVVLPKGHTGSSLFHRVLLGAVEEFPKVFESCDFPRDATTFKRDYGAILARFEAARTVAPERIEIARSIARRSQAALEFSGEGRRQPLAEHFAQKPAPVELEQRKLGEVPRLALDVPLDGKRYRGREVADLVERLAEHQEITIAARNALRFVLDRIDEQGGRLDLRGHSFALLGAGAELAPTRMLLMAGARVLWIDVADPTRWLQGNTSNGDSGADAGLSGTLLHTPAAAHLLKNPGAVVEAIRRFAADSGPVHVGMFAYAPGAGQEWRLGAAMNAIVSQLSSFSVGSVALLVSPTTPATLQAESLEAALSGLANAARWKSALCRAGLLRAPGYYSAGGVQIARATVSVQGLSYQAAQYIEKMLVAESYAVQGIDSNGREPRPLTVSANVAGITRTRSMAHPIFQAAFVGAPAFGVRIFDPDTTRALNGLLILHDLLNPSAPGASALQPDDARQKASGLFSQQIHGGLYNLPYVLEHAIRIAALIGMGRRPSLIMRRRAAPPRLAAAQ